MKRIALLIESLESGGAQRQLVGLATMLSRRGYDVKLFCYYDRDFYAAELRQAGVAYEVVRDDRRHLTRIPRIAATLKKFGADVVISYLDTPGMMACLIKKLTFAHWKLIVSERNTTQRLSRRERLKFRLYRYADVIVPNSVSQARFITEHYPHLSHKVRTITNFVDTGYFSPPAVQGEKTREGLRMICVGRIVPQKNITRFLEGMATVKERLAGKLRVDWYGEKYDQGYFERCQDILEANSLHDMFAFHEPSASIRDEYRKSDIFCLPSIYEGFPNVLCEAMSCGLAVVCSNVCDNASIAVEGKSGYLFDPESVDSIAGAIDRIMSCGKAELDEMGRFNRSRAAESFSPHTFQSEYVDLIENDCDLTKRLRCDRKQ